MATLIKFGFLALALFYSGSLLACKCEAYMIKPIDEKAKFIFSSANNVFLAKVTKSTLLGDSKDDTTRMHYFESVESFKGNPKEFSNLQTGSKKPTSCEFDGMDVGNHYLVFSDTKHLSACSAMKVALENDYYKKLLLHLSELRDNKHKKSKQLMN